MSSCECFLSHSFSPWEFSVDFSYPGQTLQARNEVSDHRPIWGLFYSDVDSDEDLYGDLQSLKLH